MAIPMKVMDQMKDGKVIDKYILTKTWNNTSWHITRNELETIKRHVDMLWNQVKDL